MSGGSLLDFSYFSLRPSPSNLSAGPIASPAAQVVNGGGAVPESNYVNVSLARQPMHNGGNQQTPQLQHM